VPDLQAQRHGVAGEETDDGDTFHVAAGGTLASGVKPAV
jgi:hypothetical protein